MGWIRSGRTVLRSGKVEARRCKMSRESNLISVNISVNQPVPRASAPTARKLQITLLSPRGPLYRHRGGIWKKTMRYAPLTLTTLASLVPEEIPAEITLLDEGVDEIDVAG